MGCLGDTLRARDVPDGPNRSAPNFARPLGDRIGHCEDLIALIVEHQVVIAKMRTCHVPMEVFCLEVEREDVGEQAREGCANIAGGIR